MLEYLLSDIEKALNNKLYFIALQSTLTIPDICSALESDNGKTDGKSYAKWYDKNVKKENDYMTGDDCYFYRCSCIHQGVSCNPKMNYTRVLFLYPNTHHTFHNNKLNDVLNIDLIIFCQQMIMACKRWLNINTDNPVVNKNYEKIMKVYPNGIQPYLVGVTVIG